MLSYEHSRFFGAHGGPRSILLPWSLRVIRNHGLVPFRTVFLWGVLYLRFSRQPQSMGSGGVVNTSESASPTQCGKLHSWYRFSAFCMQVSESIVHTWKLFSKAR